MVTLKYDEVEWLDTTFATELLKMLTHSMLLFIQEMLSLRSNK